MKIASRIMVAASFVAGAIFLAVSLRSVRKPNWQQLAGSSITVSR